MNHTPLEDQVHDALHRTADPLERHPFTVGDVRTRARRIQRRRASLAGAAVAAMVAVAVPIGLGMVGPAQRSEVPPVTQPPSPTVTGTVRIEPRSAEVVESTTVPLVDVDAPSLITPDGPIALPRAYDTITPYLDGWVGVAMDEGRGTLEFLDSDLDVDDSAGPTGGLVVSPDGERIAWSEYTGSQWQVVLADPSGGTERVYTRFAPGPEAQRIEPVGFVSDSAVVVRRNDGNGTMTTYLADGDTPVELPGPITAQSASPVTGMVTGVTSSDLQGSCSAVVDGRARTGEAVWETCDHLLDSFSPDGQHVVGFAPDSDGYGSPTVSILDASTGEPLLDFEVVGSRRQVVAFHDRVAWEGGDSLVLTMLSGDERFVVRLGLDGSVQRVGGASSIDSSGLVVAEAR
jgi:hypothetical protein